MQRIIYAAIAVDEEKAFTEFGDGLVAYLEHEFGWLEPSQISLEDCFIADDDEEDEWKAYRNYLTEWAFTHSGDMFKGMSPACFDEWKANEGSGKVLTRLEAADIVEMFEDVLVQYNISVPSPEDDERDRNDMLGLYGSVYSDLIDGIEYKLNEIIDAVKKGAEVITDTFNEFDEED